MDNAIDLKSKKEKLYEIKAELTPCEDETSIELVFKFKKPSVSSFDRYIKNVSKNSMKAMKTFIQDNIIEEQQAELEENLDKYPALALGIGEKLLTMLGLPKDTNFKML